MSVTALLTYGCVISGRAYVSIQRHGNYQTSRLVMHNADHHTWRKATLERVLPDATVVIRYDDSKRNSHIIDLTKERYRWIYSEATDVATGN